MTGTSHSADVVEHALPAHDLLVTEVLVSGQSALAWPVQGAEALNLEQALSQTVSKTRSALDAREALPPDNLIRNLLYTCWNRRFSLYQDLCRSRLASWLLMSATRSSC